MFEIKPISGLGVDVYVFLRSLALFGIKTARACDLSVLCVNQSEGLATKRAFGVITLWITDYLISFSGLTAFSPVTGLSYVIAVLLQELTVFFYRMPVYCASMIYLDESAT